MAKVAAIIFGVPEDFNPWGERSVRRSVIGATR